MPIRVQGDLPAKEILERENIFVMDETRAVHQDIRPLKLVILNLMIGYIGPVIGSHAGVGMVTLHFMGSPR